MSQWNTNKKYKFKNGRCIEATYDYFEWACNLTYDDSYGYSKKEPKYGKLTDQAKDYRKIKKLYEWWKSTRPNRKNPYDDPCLDDIEDICDKKKVKLHDKAYQIEQDYELEDTKMLIELIKLRHFLWT